MTLFDILFVSLAGLELVAVGVLAYVGLQVLQTMKKAQKTVEPTLSEAKAVAQVGAAMANHARANGEVVAKRVKLVADRVRHRVEHTKRVVKELKPQGEQASHAIQAVGDRTREAVQTARTLGDLAQRIRRVKAAAQAAADAAQNP